jgi:hypothetical protein
MIKNKHIWLKMDAYRMVRIVERAAAMAEANDEFFDMVSAGPTEREYLTKALEEQCQPEESKMNEWYAGWGNRVV